MNCLKKTTTCLFTILIVTVSFSQVNQNIHALDKKYEACCNKQHGDYGALNCAIDMVKDWEKELNKYYWGLMKVLDSTSQNDLKLAQRQWAKYKDLETKLSNNIHNLKGTMYLRMRAYRHMKIVRARALELKSYYWIRTEEDDVKNYHSNQTIDRNSLQKNDSILPIPDEIFFSSPKPLAENIIEKYIKSYFQTTKPPQVIARAAKEHGEPVSNCHIIDDYGTVSIETYSCDMEIKQTLRFKNYTFKEIKKILRILLKDNEHNKWNANKYGPIKEGAGDCYTEIKKEEGLIVINYYCVGC